MAEFIIISDIPSTYSLWGLGFRVWLLRELIIGIAAQVFGRLDDLTFSIL